MTSPGRSRWISVSVSVSTSQIRSSSRPRRSWPTSSRRSPGSGPNSRACSPRPSPSHFSATTESSRRPEDPQGRVARVAVLGVGHDQQLVVPGECVDRRRVGVPVDHPGGPAGRREPQLAAVVGRAADRDQRAADLEPGGVGRFDLRDGDGVRAAREGLRVPDAELVAVGVGEPPDGLAVRAERAHQRPVGAVGHLAALVGLAVPGVLLDDAADVGGVEAAVRGVVRPLRQGHPRGAEACLPAGGDLGGKNCGGGGGSAVTPPSSQDPTETTQGPPSAAPEQCVGVTGFEPAASSSRTTRATKLRHTPRSVDESSVRSPLLRRRAQAGPGGERQQRRLGRAGEPDRRVRTGAQPRRDVQPGAASVQRCSQRTRARSMPQLVTSAP